MHVCTCFHVLMDGEYSRYFELLPKQVIIESLDCSCIHSTPFMFFCFKQFFDILWVDSYAYMDEKKH